MRIDELVGGGPSLESKNFRATETMVLINKQDAEGGSGDPSGQFERQLFTNQDEQPAVITFTTDSDSEIPSSATGLQQRPDIEPAVVWAATIRDKSSGLTAPAVRTEIRSFDSTGHLKDTVSLKGVVSPDATSEDKVTGVLAVGSVVVVEAVNNGNKLVVAADLKTGKQLWRKSCHSEAFDELTAGPSGIVVVQCDHSLLGIDAQTGARKWTTDLTATSGGETWVRDIGGPTSPVHNGWVVMSEAGNSAALLNIGTGGLTWGKSAYIDPMGDLSIINGLGFEGGSIDSLPDATVTLRVTRISTGKTVYQLRAGQQRSLGSLRILGAYDGRMWIWTGDGLDVIDARTGARDSLAPKKKDGFQQSKNVPISAGATWVYLSNTNGFGDPTPATLVRGPEGITAQDLPRSEITGLN